MNRDNSDQGKSQEAHLFSQSPANLLSPQDLTSPVLSGRNLGKSPWRRLLPVSWQVWAILATIVFGSAGAIALALLFRIPGLPNCPAIFWPTASASLRLYCAQVAAGKQTLDNLLEAIALVNNLPSDHPLRPDIDRWVEKWSLELLELGEQAFHQGQLAQATEIAEKVPENTRAHGEVPERIQRWRSVWTQAEGIYQQAETALRQESWRRAFSQAVRLFAVDNRYWRTTQYEALNRKIIIAQQDDQKIAKARNLTRRGGLDNLVAAIQLLQDLSPESYFHKSAQRVMVQTARSLLDIAKSNLVDQDLQGAIAIAERVPANTALWQEAQDFIELAHAESWTWSDSIVGLEEAIAQARRIGSNRPLYSQAQDLMAQWELEIQALQLLNPAREWAQVGSAKGLSAAITQVQRIPPGNPRWQEAQQETSRWTQEIQTIEDQPILSQADQYASAGDLASLNSAIRTARRIGPGRSLYQEAQNKIQEWAQQIQAEKDLQRGRYFPDNGLDDGLDIRSEELLRTGWDLAAKGTPQALAEAIQTANQISSSSTLRIQADQAMDQWGQQILELARQRVRTDRAAAIAIAQQVPRSTSAYADAQFQIQAWRTGN